MRYCGQCRYYQRVNRDDGRCKLYGKVVRKGAYACEVGMRKERKVKVRVIVCGAGLSVVRQE